MRHLKVIKVESLSGTYINATYRQEVAARVEVVARLGHAAQSMMDIGTYFRGGGDAAHAVVTAWAWRGALDPRSDGSAQHRRPCQHSSHAAVPF